MKENKSHSLMLALAAVGIVVVAIVSAVVGAASGLVGTFWALVPPIVAIALALITKEV